ncbi:MAG TPA: zinc-ribbon domain-containing protein [Acidobacteriaceae bacterium]
MAFCGRCGTQVADGVAFCPNCGASIGVPTAAPVGAPVAAAPITSGLQENVAGLLCYSLGFITGILFLLIDKRPFVRFHAAQSIVVFGGLFLIRVVLGFGFMGTGYYAFWGLLSMLIGLITIVLWIVLMVQAYQGKRFEVPIVAGIAKSIAGNPSL